MARKNSRRAVSKAKAANTARVIDMVRAGLDGANPAFLKAWDSLSEADRQVLLADARDRA